MEEKYPTKKELKFIEKFDVTKKPVKELIEFIEGIWWMPSFGFLLKKRRNAFKTVTTTKDKPKYRYHMYLELHTGGWSGNEDIIKSLDKNKWFSFFFKDSWKRGGHFTYEIPINLWERKSKRNNTKAKV